MYLYQKYISTVTGSKLELQKNRESKQLFKIKLPEIYRGQYYLFESQFLEGIMYWKLRPIREYQHFLKFEVLLLIHQPNIIF